MQHYDHALLGAVLTMALGVQRRFGWAVVVTGAAASSFPDWDDLPGGVHRVWGHSLLVAPLTCGLIGGLGYWCYQAVRGRGPFSPTACAVWVAVGLLASLSHVLADLLYSGTYLAAEWPVALLWPLSPRRWALPLVPWADRGVTLILLATLILVCLAPRRSQVLAALSLVVILGYVGLWGFAAMLIG
jgi:membrane-bound metal-dependent hydrolase YbcI (DUF457 family)